MPFDVFVSHSSKDKLVADAVCARLEASGIRCWIAPRDIVAGTSYGESIIDAIHSAKVMVLVLSANANSSGHIPKEVERAVSNGVAVVPFRIEDVPPGKSLDYFIGSVHWLDALTPPLEKHLDELAETVLKLIPQMGDGRGSPAPFQTVMGKAATPLPPAFQPPAPSAAPGAAASASSSKMIWIGVAAAILVLAVVLGIIFLRPKPAVPSGSATSTVTPSPNPQLITPNAGPTPGPGPSAAVDPIVGCYHWFNNGSVLIHSNGIIQGGPFTGRWRLVNSAQRKYTFTWPAAIDTVTLTADQRSFSGGNQYGYPIAATRVAGSIGIQGTWNVNNIPLLVPDNNTFTYANFSGTWQVVDISRGIYILTWPDPVDSVTLSADDQTISGANQYGVATSGTRVEPCNVN